MDKKIPLLGFFIILTLVAVPFVVFWSIEVLTGFSVSFNFRTGLAFWVLALLFNGLSMSWR